MLTSLFVLDHDFIIRPDYRGGLYHLLLGVAKTSRQIKLCAWSLAATSSLVWTFYSPTVMMFDQLTTWFATPIWLHHVARIVAFYLLAWLVHRLAPLIAGRLVQLPRFTPRTHQPGPERQTTLQGLISSTISFIAFAAATLASLSLFVPANTLIWMVGLFSAAFGLGARPVISDFLTGISLIFEDTFAVGEKVDVAGVEGVVEEVNLRITAIRAS